MASSSLAQQGALNFPAPVFMACPAAVRWSIRGEGEGEGALNPRCAMHTPSWSLIRLQITSP